MAAPKSEPTVFVGIVLDFETGDLDPQNGACTQIAMKAVRLDTWEVIDTYMNYIYPYKHKSDILGKTRKKVLKNKREIEEEEGQLMKYEEAALTYSDISMDMLYEKGVDVEQVASDVIDFATRNTLSKSKTAKPFLIGQNIVFDCGFLQQLMAYGGKLKEFAKVFAGITDFWGNFQPHYVDTIDLGKLTFAGDPEVTSYKLELLAERLGIELDDAHDADADVTATLHVAIVCSNRLRNSDGSSTGAGLQKKEKSRTHFKI